MGAATRRNADGKRMRLRCIKQPTMTAGLDALYTAFAAKGREVRLKMPCVLSIVNAER